SPMCAAVLACTCAAAWAFKPSKFVEVEVLADACTPALAPRFAKTELKIRALALKLAPADVPRFTRDTVLAPDVFAAVPIAAFFSTRPFASAVAPRTASSDPGLLPIAAARTAAALAVELVEALAV